MLLVVKCGTNEYRTKVYNSTDYTLSDFVIGNSARGNIKEIEIPPHDTSEPFILSYKHSFLNFFGEARFNMHITGAYKLNDTILDMFSGREVSVDEFYEDRTTVVAIDTLYYYADYYNFYYSINHE